MLSFVCAGLPAASSHPAPCRPSSVPYFSADLSHPEPLGRFIFLPKNQFNSEQSRRIAQQSAC